MFKFFQSQYIFIHDALMEHLAFGVTEVEAQELRDYVRRLQQPNENGELPVDKEFHVTILFRKCLNFLAGEKSSF